MHLICNHRCLILRDFSSGKLLNASQSSRTNFFSRRSSLDTRIDDCTYSETIFGVNSFLFNLTDRCIDHEARKGWRFGCRSAFDAGHTIFLWRSSRQATPYSFSFRILFQFSSIIILCRDHHGLFLCLAAAHRAGWCRPTARSFCHRSHKQVTISKPPFFLYWFSLYLEFLILDRSPHWFSSPLDLKQLTQPSSGQGGLERSCMSHYRALRSELSSWRLLLGGSR